MNLDIQQILSQIVAFLILLAILKLFAWKPILEALDARKQKIAQDLEEIEEAKVHIETLKQDYERNLRSIEEKARHRIVLAIAEGKSIAGQIQEEARQKSHELLQKTKENLALEVAKAKAELKDEIARLVVEASEKLIGKALDDKRQNALVMEFIDELSKNKDKR